MMVQSGVGVFRETCYTGVDTTVLSPRYGLSYAASLLPPERL